MSWKLSLVYKTGRVSVTELTYNQTIMPRGSHFLQNWLMGSTAIAPVICPIILFWELFSAASDRIFTRTSFCVTAWQLNSTSATKSHQYYKILFQFRRFRKWVCTTVTYHYIFCGNLLKKFVFGLFSALSTMDLETR